MMTLFLPQMNRIANTRKLFVAVLLHLEKNSFAFFTRFSTKSKLQQNLSPFLSRLAGFNWFASI